QPSHVHVGVVRYWRGPRRPVEPAVAVAIYSTHGHLGSQMRCFQMNTTFVDTRASGQASAYGGAIDAIGGIAAAVIAIIGLAGFHPATMTAISVIVFGAAMLIQGGTLLSEYAVVIQVVPSAAEGESDGGMSIMFLAGVAGIVLGILALLGIAARPLTAVAILAFGAALTLSSTSVRRLFLLQAAARRVSSRSGTEMLAGEMASGSAGV